MDQNRMNEPVTLINKKIMYLFTIIKTLFWPIQTNERDSDAECSSVLVWNSSILYLRLQRMDIQMTITSTCIKTI